MNTCETYVKPASEDEETKKFIILYEQNIANFNKETEDSDNINFDLLPPNFRDMDIFVDKNGTKIWVLTTDITPPVDHLYRLSEEYHVALEGEFHNGNDNIHGRFVFTPGAEPFEIWQTYNEETGQLEPLGKGTI